MFRCFTVTLRLTYTQKMRRFKIQLTTAVSAVKLDMKAEQNSTKTHLQKAFGRFPALIVVLLISHLYPLATLLGCKGIVVPVSLDGLLEQLVHGLGGLAAHALLLHPQPHLPVALRGPQAGASRCRGCFERNVLSVLYIDIACRRIKHINTSIK